MVSYEVNSIGATGAKPSAARKDRHLHRRQDSATSSKVVHNWQRLCWLTE